MQDWPSPAAENSRLPTRSLQLRGSFSPAVITAEPLVLTDGLDSCGGDVCALAPDWGSTTRAPVGLGLEQGTLVR